MAQGFTQKIGIDNDETFCPVVRFESKIYNSIGSQTQPSVTSTRYNNRILE